MVEIVRLPSGDAAVENSETLSEAFSHGWGKGLWELLCRSIPENAGNSCFFYRKLARDYAANICFLRDRSSAEVFEAALPAEDEIVRILYDRPPLPGGEYVDVSAVQQMLRELAGYLKSLWENEFSAPADWLITQLPEFGDVGKITFHLAENKQDLDGEHPFLFLCTFVHRLDGQDEPRHLPLANALKLFAVQKEKISQLLQTIQKAGKCCTVIGELLENQRIFQVVPFTAADAYTLLNAHDVLENSGIALRMVNLWKRRPPKLKLELTLTNPSGGELSEHALLHFKTEAVLDGQVLKKDELDELLKSSGGLVRFKEKWVEADGEKVRKLLELWGRADRFSQHAGLSFTAGMRLLAGNRPHAGSPSPDPELCEVKISPELEAVFAGRSPRCPAMPALPEHLEKILRPYQKEGVHFLWRMTSLGLGVFLADDMGLGKSLQVLSFLELLRLKGGLNGLPALLIVPASLLENWRLEGEKFVPGLNITLLHPSRLKGAEMEELQRNPVAFLQKSHLVVTTYNMILRLGSLREMLFPVIIADEAQALKNSSSQQSRAVRSLKGERRVALTGTPVENHLGDLWSIGDFLNPGLFGFQQEFSEKCREMAEKKNWSPLRKMLSPIVLRRLKTDRKIVPDLPDKSERNIYCSFSKLQTAVYSAVLDRMRSELKDCDDMTRKGVILKYLTALKQICDHPDLYRGGALFEQSESGKLQQLETLVAQIAMKHEKVLVFTQFREMTPVLHDLLARVFGRPGAILHGGTPVGERAKLVEAFQRPGGVPFFVLSLKAAGTGLTLTAANHVIHFDRWWNPAVENQATDRAYRIGQHQNVMVHKFLCAGTIESRIDRMLRRKQNVANALFEPGEGAHAFTEWSDEELFELTRLENCNE